MKLIVYIWIIFVLFFIGAVYVVTHARSYEQSIIGRWQEVSWEFEKSDAPEAGDTAVLLSGSQKDEIWEGLTIHKAELWEFRPEKEINLYDANRRTLKKLEWTIKGRGNILEIRHPDHHTENYQIQEIKDDQMVVHFNFDLQVRGIVKMTFKRIQS
jgi:hypothetical protein